eukprot:Sspe_Gene.89147::Locus_60986_Transcript_1_1_Confidence_1.000_Length_2569::g.89147::m.89147
MERGTALKRFREDDFGRPSRAVQSALRQLDALLEDHAACTQDVEEADQQLKVTMEELNEVVAELEKAADCEVLQAASEPLKKTFQAHFPSLTTWDTASGPILVRSSGGELLEMDGNALNVADSIFSKASYLISQASKDAHCRSPVQASRSAKLEKLRRKAHDLAAKGKSEKQVAVEIADSCLTSARKADLKDVLLRKTAENKWFGAAGNYKAMLEEVLIYVAEYGVLPPDDPSHTSESKWKGENVSSSTSKRGHAVHAHALLDALAKVSPVSYTRWSPPSQCRYFKADTFDPEAAGELAAEMDKGRSSFSVRLAAMARRRAGDRLGSIARLRIGAQHHPTLLPDLLDEVAAAATVSPQGQGQTVAAFLRAAAYEDEVLTPREPAVPLRDASFCRDLEQGKAPDSHPDSALAKGPVVKLQPYEAVIRNTEFTCPHRLVGILLRYASALGKDSSVLSQPGLLERSVLRCLAEAARSLLRFSPETCEKAACKVGREGHSRAAALTLWMMALVYKRLGADRLAVAFLWGQVVRHHTLLPLHTFNTAVLFLAFGLGRGPTTSAELAALLEAPITLKLDSIELLRHTRRFIDTTWAPRVRDLVGEDAGLTAQLDGLLQQMSSEALPAPALKGFGNRNLSTIHTVHRLLARGAPRDTVEDILLSWREAYGGKGDLPAEADGVVWVLWLLHLAINGRAALADAGFMAAQELDVPTDVAVLLCTNHAALRLALGLSAVPALNRIARMDRQTRETTRRGAPGLEILSPSYLQPILSSVLRRAPHTLAECENDRLLADAPCIRVLSTLKRIRQGDAKMAAVADRTLHHLLPGCQVDGVIVSH